MERAIAKAKDQERLNNDRVNSIEVEHEDRTISSMPITREQLRREINMSKHIIVHSQPTNTAITFTKEELKRLLHPYNDPHVVKMKIANNKVFHILINSGSSTGILFIKAYRKLRLDHVKLQPIKTPLYGFIGKCVHTRVISLLVAIGESSNQLNHMVDFLVVGKKSSYNAIISQPTLNTIRAAISTYHLIMKFLTDNGIGSMFGDQVKAKECYASKTLKLGKEKSQDEP